MWVILLIIIALVAWTNGDSSGVEMILKIVAIGALFLGSLWLLVKVPWLVIGVVIYVIVYFAQKSYKQNKEIKNNSIDEKTKDIHEEKIEEYINISNSKFKDELNQNTKTPEEYENERWLVESEKIIKQANSDYKYIKIQLMSNARSGEYLIIGDKKCVFFNYESKYIDNYINRKDQSIRSNKLLGGRDFHGQLLYEIKDIKQYNFYIETLMTLALEDDIIIKPTFIEECRTVTKNVSLPYTYTGQFIYLHKINAELRCSIEY